MRRHPARAPVKRNRWKIILPLPHANTAVAAGNALTPGACVRFAHGFQQIDILQLGVGDARIAATFQRRNQIGARGAAGIEREFAGS